ncbi:MAG: PD-(D/E)XK nuclease family protein, partial [Blastochloris sp.]|nr:PD-(D/E)XK nuclease family protein [Blastochloris sp.]
MDFGTLTHAVLENMGRDPVMSRTTETALLRDFLRAELDRQVLLNFGHSLSLSTMIQIEALQKRLDAFAEKQSAEASQGWIIDEVETSFELKLESWTVRGKVDRIDRHPDGRVRLLDYKTSDQRVAPAAAHLKKIKSEPDPSKFPPEAITHLNGTMLLWKISSSPSTSPPAWKNIRRKNLICIVVIFSSRRQHRKPASNSGKIFDPTICASALLCASQVLQAIDGGTILAPAGKASLEQGT